MAQITKRDMLNQHNPPVSYGDCFRACLATLFGVLTKEVPNFVEISDEGWWDVVNEWTQTRGWHAVHFECHNGWTAPGWAIACGKSNKSLLQHAVVYRDGDLWHDPAASRSGLSEINGYIVFIPTLATFERLL